MTLVLVTYLIGMIVTGIVFYPSAKEATKAYDSVKVGFAFGFIVVFGQL